MKFEYAYLEMLKGNKITRPCFKGYWYIDGVDGKVKIHLADGKVIHKGDLTLTIQNTLAEDWDVLYDQDDVYYTFPCECTRACDNANGGSDGCCCSETPSECESCDCWDSNDYTEGMDNEYVFKGNTEGKLDFTVGSLVNKEGN